MGPGFQVHAVALPTDILNPALRPSSDRRAGEDCSDCLATGFSQVVAQILHLVD
jgi:hypothetical protein